MRPKHKTTMGDFQMRTRLLFSVAVAALIAGAGVGYAQDQMKRDQGGGAQMNAPSGSQQGGAGAGKSTTGAASSEEGGKAGSKAGGAANEKNEKTEPKGKAGQGAQGPSRGEKAGTTGQAGQEGGQMKSPSAQEKSKGTTGQSNEGSSKGTTGQGTSSSSQTQQQPQQQPQGAPSGTQTQQRGSQSGTGTTGQGAAGVQGAANLSSEQRTKITSTIKSKSTEFKSVENVNFSISVGTRVPRTGVTFYTLPTEVVEVYPAWRGFKFILVRGEILVIDPNTYEIVAVLPA
jgi:hypothetical protein